MKALLKRLGLLIPSWRCCADQFAQSSCRAEVQWPETQLDALEKAMEIQSVLNESRSCKSK